MSLEENHLEESNMEKHLKKEYDNCFCIEEVPQNQSYLYYINILSPEPMFRNLRNMYYRNWASFGDPQRAFRRREKIIRKGKLKQGDVAVYAIHYTPSMPKP